MPARQAWDAGGHAGQDAHVNTSATRFSEARANAPAQQCRRFARRPLPVGFLSRRPIRPRFRFDRPQWQHVGARRQPRPDRLHRTPACHARPRPAAVSSRMRCHACTADGVRPAARRRRPAGSRPAHAHTRWTGCGCARTAPNAARHAHAAGRRRAFCRTRQCMRRRHAKIAGRSRASHGAPSFRFVRSQGLPCRHCSGLV